MDQKILDKAMEDLGLEKVIQVSLVNRRIKEKDYKFLGIGQVVINYGSKIGKTDVFAARLAGSDNNKCVVKGDYKSSLLNMEIPKESTHYCLGDIEIDEEMYINSGVTHYRELIPIVFLNKS